MSQAYEYTRKRSVLIIGSDIPDPIEYTLI